MVSVFYSFQVQAASLAVAMSVVNPEFSGSAAAETANEFEWQVVASGW